jgi:hypothetical protein
MPLNQARAMAELRELRNYGDTLPIAQLTAPCSDTSMARIGRIVVPGFPHHVTQRGNRRQRVFFEPADFALYRDLLAERCAKPVGRISEA